MLTYDRTCCACSQTDAATIEITRKRTERGRVMWPPLSRFGGQSVAEVPGAHSSPRVECIQMADVIPCPEAPPGLDVLEGIEGAMMLVEPPPVGERNLEHEL